jgi:hypothetical protein
MSLCINDYWEVRKYMQPGDVIAFGGNDTISNVVKLATRSSVSHVGTILQSKVILEEAIQDGFLNHIIESTSLNGFNGVVVNRMSDRLSDYDGNVWWLPLRNEARERFCGKSFFDFLLKQERKPYDFYQAFEAGVGSISLSVLRKIFGEKENFSKFFCSELVVAAFEIAGLLSDVNASEVTPIDLCMFSIYQDNYYQIKGNKETQIKGFNTLNPSSWGID